MRGLDHPHIVRYFGTEVGGAGRGGHVEVETGMVPGRAGGVGKKAMRNRHRHLGRQHHHHHGSSGYNNDQDIGTASVETEGECGEEVSLDLGEAVLGARVFIFMEYISGGSLARMLRQFGPFGEPLIRRYTRQ